MDSYLVRLGKAMLEDLEEFDELIASGDKLAAARVEASIKEKLAEIERQVS